MRPVAPAAPPVLSLVPAGPDGGVHPGAEAGAAGRGDAVDPGDPGDRGPWRILLVDDLASIHADFRRILLPAGPGGADQVAGEAAAAALDDLEAALFAEPAEAVPSADPADRADRAGLADPADPGAAPTGPAAGMAVAAGSAAGAASGASRPARRGFTLDSAYQGQEALQRVQAAVAAGLPYAMAFIDMRMPPGWDGVETVRRLWQVDPALQVVICTAYSDYAWDDVLDRLQAHERLLILKKPFDAIEVSQLAHTLCAKWSSARQVARHTQALEAAVRQRTAELQAANLRLREELDERQRQQAALQAQEAQIRHLAFHDPLTGLANRALLMERLGRALARARAEGLQVGLMFIDLDRFKPVNDALGHAVGDALLQAVGQRLRESIRLGDTAARIGGDEFVLLFEALPDAQLMPRLAERLVAQLAEPVQLGPHRVGAGASIGVACGPQDGDSVDALMRHADLAMYAAKAGGREGYRLFDRAMLVSAA